MGFALVPKVWVEVVVCLGEKGASLLALEFKD